MKKQIIDIYPLSFTQQGMLYDTLKAPESGMHIEQFAFTLSGNLDVAAFQSAWQRIINQYTVLRTGFVWEANTQPVQVVLKNVEIALYQEDWRGLSPETQTDRLQTFLSEERSKPFKLSQPPLIRLALFQTSDTTYEFAWTYHHILMDGWCNTLLMKDFVRYYQALLQHRDIQLTEERPYKDYIRWLGKQDRAAATAFWQGYLQGFTKPTALGKEELAEAAPAPLSAEKQRAIYLLNLTPELTHALQALVSRHNVTLNTLIQGTWATLLSRYNQADDILFGMTTSGRPPALAGVESMVGLFINTLPMRIRLNAQESFWSSLSSIQEQNAELRQYEYTPGSDIYQCSEVAGSLLLYESLLVFENYPTDTLANLEIQLSNLRSIGAQTQYALTLLVTIEKQIGLRCVYDTQRLSAQAIEQIFIHLSTLLKFLVSEENPSVEELRELIPLQQIPTIYPEQTGPGYASQSPYRAPRNPEEEILAGIYEQVLGLPRIGIDDNFFELGGHSLLATQLVTRVRNQFSVELPLRLLFEAPTVAQMARHVSTLQATRQGLQRSSIAVVSRESPIAASFAQQRLWFLDRLNPHTDAYNTPIMAQITGDLHVSALYQSMRALIQRHEVLRTTFAEIDGEPVQIIANNASLYLPVIDLQACTDAEQAQQISLLVGEIFHLPINLQTGPVLRTILLRLQPQKHLFVIIIHHIAFDAWSGGVFIRELSHLYTAFSSDHTPDLPPLPIQYADFAVWQRQWLQGDILNELRAYWKNQLSDVPPLLLPTDRPALDYSHFHGASTAFALPQALSQHIYSLSKQEGVTVFMTLFTAFQVLLYRYTGQEDLVIGTDIANRLHTETEMLIGFFVNLLPLRTNLSGQPGFLEALHRVQEMVLQAYAHQDLPFDMLVNALHLERNTNQVPLVRALFVQQNAPLPPVQLADLQIEAVRAELTSTKFDLAVFITDTAEGLQGTINYSTDLFEDSTIQKMIRHFQNLLQSIVSQPDMPIDRLEMFSVEEKRQIQQKEAEQLEAGRRKLKLAKRNPIHLIETTE